MKPSNPVQSMPVYASDSAYRRGPSPEQQLAGVVPLDTLPADWWNWLWEQITTRINETVGGLESVYDEILSVLTDAEITPSDLQVNQLLTAIKAITQRVGSSGTAGAVKSSSDSGKVAIDADGYMSPNGMGVPSSLNTTAKSIVSAINELLAALNAYKTSNDGAVQALDNGKAPVDHSSADATYGVATTTKYGHVKLSGTYTEDEEGTGVAATQSGLAGAYDALKTMIEMAGGLPTTVASDPIVNITGNGTEAVEGTINIATSGFYYIDMQGGCGGNGGTGGRGGDGGAGRSAASGGVGGRGSFQVFIEGDPETSRSGGLGKAGVRKEGIYFLPAGEYSYKVGGRGGNGGNGGNGGPGQNFATGTLGTASGGSGGSGGATGADGYNCTLGVAFSSFIARGADGGRGANGNNPSNYTSAGGGGGGGAGGWGGWGGTTTLSGPNIELKTLGGPGGVGYPGGGGGGGAGYAASKIAQGGAGGSGGSNASFEGISLLGFEWTTFTLQTPGNGGTSSYQPGAAGAAGAWWTSNKYYGQNPNTSLLTPSGYITAYLQAESYGPSPMPGNLHGEGYLKIYPLI